MTSANDTFEGRFPIGPDTARLLIHTGREGLAAKVGHDLTIRFDSWSGDANATGDGGSVSATVDVDTLVIVEGTGGALPLTNRDRADIKETARRLLETSRYPHATFTSTAVSHNGDSGSIEGTLTIKGKSTPVTITATRTHTGWRGRTTIRQTDFGIQPYRAFLGALKLADAVRIDIEVDLPTSG